MCHLWYICECALCNFEWEFVSIFIFQDFRIKSQILIDISSHRDCCICTISVRIAYEKVNAHEFSYNELEFNRRSRNKRIAQYSYVSFGSNNIFEQNITHLLSDNTSTLYRRQDATWCWLQSSQSFQMTVCSAIGLLVCIGISCWMARTLFMVQK